MRPEGKNESFPFRRNAFATNSNSSSRSQNCRAKLQERFDKDVCETSPSDRSVLSVLSLNDTRRAFRNGAEKISRTFSSVRISLGNFSQRFKSSTRRRQILEEGPMTPNPTTPQARLILGRTPTKLYSPFGIESPKTTTCKEDKENVGPSSTSSSSSSTKEHWPRKRNLLEEIF